MTHHKFLTSLAALLCLIASDGMAQTFKGLTSTDVEPIQVVLPDPEPMEPPIDTLKRRDGSYAVLLVNSTPLTVRRIRIDGGAWISTQPIRRTCERSEFQLCFKNKEWALLATVDCGSDYSMEIQMTDSGGKWYRSKGSWSLSTDCEFLGGVLGMIE
jgi:hypothetical protein